jgi:hypothetical protein
MIAFPTPDHVEADENRGRAEFISVLADERVRMARYALMGTAKALREVGLLWEARIVFRAAAEVMANLRNAYEAGRPAVMRCPLPEMLTKLRSRRVIDKMVFQIGRAAALHNGQPGSELDDLNELVGILAEPFDSLDPSAIKSQRSEKEAKLVYCGHSPDGGRRARV